MRKHPLLYEINTRVWLERLSARAGKKLTLLSVPEEEWKKLADQGFDFLWLMGVWQRSPGGRKIALTNQSLLHEFSKILPGWTEKDVAASPYAVYDYSLDQALGEKEDLPKLKIKLNQFGLRLMLDFVPNHFALDHPWTLSHPGRFIRVSQKESKSHPGFFYKTKNGDYLAHGRDPYFPPWNDTVQVNYFSPEMRAAMQAELEQVAAVADGVRCDMAMLDLNEIFSKTWGDFLKKVKIPQQEFWSTAIAHIKSKNPEFVFMAEVYWDLEWKLQQLGFDFTYDKKFYDRLCRSSAGDINGHLQADMQFQDHCARFIENHDEPRAAAVLSGEKSQAAAIAMATVPGLRFFHDGQFQGKCQHLPVQLAREPLETADSRVETFYERLLAILRDPVFHEGQWTLLEPLPGGGDHTGHENFLAWIWSKDNTKKVIVINYSSATSQCHLKLDAGTEAPVFDFYDELDHRIYTWQRKDLQRSGLFVSLEPWKAHIFSIRPARS